MRKTTARDVAGAANVSVATVDRVLNDRGGVHPDKERRVLDWARKLKLDRALGHRAARTLRVAVLMQPPANPFYAAVHAAFEATRRTHADLNIQFRLFHADPADLPRTAAVIDDLGARHDGLVVTTGRSEAIALAIRRVADRIPVITFVTDVPGSGRQAYVGPDDRRAGRVAGDLMGRFLHPAGGDVLIIAGLLAMEGHAAREAGFRAVLSERYPACRVAAVLESREQEARAGDLVRGALQRHPAIAGIYNASVGALAITDALRDLGLARRIAFVTHELTPDRRALLRNGLIDAVVDQNPEHEVRMAVETMARLTGRLDGVPGSTITPVHIHMIENA